jgi:uncharacterized protein (DUF4415 family)
MMETKPLPSWFVAVVGWRGCGVSEWACISTLMKKTQIQMPSVAEDRKITAAAKTDPDAQPLTAEQLAAMVPARALRGRPPSANKKQLVSVRYSPEVISFFRSTGEGWQARMDGVLKCYVETQAKRRARGDA